jgi:hypothetical protein
MHNPLERWGRGKRLALWLERQAEQRANKQKKAAELKAANDNPKPKKPDLKQVLHVWHDDKGKQFQKKFWEQPHKPAKAKDIPKGEQLFKAFLLAGEHSYYTGTRIQYASPFQSGAAYGAWLKHKGYKHIGSGCYSSVYAYAELSTKVIKVSRRMDPWFEFVYWAYENGHQDFAPIVHSYKYHPGKGEKGEAFYVAVVDRLEAGDGDRKRHYLSRYIFNMLYYHKSSDLHPDLLAACELLCPGLIKFTEDFCKKFRTERYSTDCGGNNILVTMDGKKWILNDPLCGSPRNDNIVKMRWKRAA